MPEASGGATGTLTIVSGGQSGVDRAALDVALELGLTCRGWCPAGRLAEDGTIDGRYPLAPTPSADPAQRTEWNVRDSDATLIISPSPLSGGTALTEQCAVKYGRPYVVVAPDRESSAGDACRWLERNRVRVLNVAGPRESKRPGVYEEARELLRAALSADRRDRETSAHRGYAVDGSDVAALNKAIDLAFDYRGDVTIVRRSAPDPVEGYVFDRRPGGTPEESLIRFLPKGSEERIRIPYADIARLEFTGRDPAAGKSFEAWMKKYVESKLAGREASIESESWEESS